MFNFKNNITEQVVNDIALLKNVNEKFKIDNKTLEKIKSINFMSSLIQSYFFRWENKIFFGRGLVRCLKF